MVNLSPKIWEKRFKGVLIEYFTGLKGYYEFVIGEKIYTTPSLLEAQEIITKSKQS